MWLTAASSMPSALHQLEQRHLRRVRLPRPQLQDPRVAARTLRVARRDLVEQLVDDELVLAERRQRLTPRVQVAALGQGDQPLDLGLHGLRLRGRGLDPLVVDQLLGQVHQERLAVRRVARQLVPVPLVAHGSGRVYAARRSRPRAFSVSMTSSIDLRPKFGIAFSSDSDFWSRSPTVWMPARFRQLYERTPSSSSSIRMSSMPSPALRAAAGPAAAGSPAHSAPPPWSASRRSWSVKIASDLMRISAASRSAACGSTEPSVSMSSVSLS